MTAVLLKGSAGMSANADWRAGKETLTNRFAALVDAEDENAVRTARRSWEDAMQTRPDLAPLPATGRPSHMETVLRDMEELHRSGRLPQKVDSVWDRLHERDVARHGGNRALQRDTIKNNLRGALRDLREDRPVRALQDYRPKR
jgi:hypothetical protein